MRVLVATPGADIRDFLPVNKIAIKSFSENLSLAVDFKLSVPSVF